VVDADMSRRDTVTIDRRYSGPARSANGGIASGLIAARASGLLEARLVVVTLLRPPPLDKPLELVSGSRRVHVLDGEDLVAIATQATEMSDPIIALVPEEQFETTYAGDTLHPFPHCFVCGTTRLDGLQLRPMKSAARPGRVKCHWRPADQGPNVASRPVAEEMIWAALDCPGGWTFDQGADTRVLARYTVSVVAPANILAEATYSIVGQLRDRSRGRVGTAMYDQSGALVARAEATWLPWTGMVERQGRPTSQADHSPGVGDPSALLGPSGVAGRLRGAAPVPMEAERGHC